MASGIIMPSMIGESVGHIVVGPDMSGSVYVTPKMIELFLTEVRAICETLAPDRLDVIYWDTQVAGHEVYKSDELDGLVGGTKPKGGGGTDPRCVSAYLRKEDIKPDCIVMLTDGYIDDWGSDWDAPVLWVVVDDGNRIVSPVGKTVHINKD
jgi:predicted metal-dependent peptidase